VIDRQPSANWQRFARYAGILLPVPAAPAGSLSNWQRFARYAGILLPVPVQVGRLTVDGRP